LRASRFALVIMEVRSVGIVGVGMMGGSIALSALRAGYRVLLYDAFASEKLAGPKFRKALVVPDLPALVSNSRFIILATPPDALEQVGSDLS
jgi:phosphoglycerate dehydrogenase-like enzyme